MTCGGCTTSSPPLECTDIFVYGLSVTVTNLKTGSPVTGAALTLTDSAYSETMQEVAPGHYVGAGERPGNYTLTIEAEGFSSVTITGLSVVSDPCHVIPVGVEQSLSPV
jgi:hypothetical protein